MSRYRVEVDQTVTYEVEVNAESVEDAIIEAAFLVRRSPPERFLPRIGTAHTIARDAVELEETPT